MRSDAVGDMVLIPGGTFHMGSDDFYPEERPVHRVTVVSFRIEAHPVTNAAFDRFVMETGYVTSAERVPDRALYPGVDASLLIPGSLVFRRPSGPVPLDDVRRWWSYVPGACWKHPEGPGSSIEGRELHPVVHVTHADAAAYAASCGLSLPTEAEWEYAARGGLESAVYAWGDDFTPDGRIMANTWQGEFPWQNFEHDGFAGTSPVGSFPANGYGLYDVTGNVWEWTDDAYVSRHTAGARSPCCVPRTPRSASYSHAEPPDAHARQHNHAQERGTLHAQASAGIPQRVVKGGSHLCAPNYCLRYRPAARQGQAVDTSASHIGFRCVVRS